MPPKQQPTKSKQNYATPQDLLTAIIKYLNIDGFVFDFAADSSNTVAANYWSEADDSLAKTPEEWYNACKSGWGFLNPPFKNISPWAKKCHEASQRGAKIAFLVPASVDTLWFSKYISYKHHWLALQGRPHFMRDKPNWGYPKGVMLVLFGYKYYAEDEPYSIWKWK